jgi:hypothetical protein
MLEPLQLVSDLDITNYDLQGEWQHSLDMSTILPHRGSWSLRDGHVMSRDPMHGSSKPFQYEAAIGGERKGLFTDT